MYQVTAPVRSSAIDYSVNGQSKDQLKDPFTNWYVNIVASAIMRLVILTQIKLWLQFNQISIYRI